MLCLVVPVIVCYVVVATGGQSKDGVTRQNLIAAPRRRSSGSRPILITR
jgi:hypothetical protein